MYFFVFCCLLLSFVVDAITVVVVAIVEKGRSLVLVSLSLSLSSSSCPLCWCSFGSLNSASKGGITQDDSRCRDATERGANKASSRDDAMLSMRSDKSEKSEKSEKTKGVSGKHKSFGQVRSKICKVERGREGFTGVNLGMLGGGEGRSRARNGDEAAGLGAWEVGKAPTTQ